MSRVCSSVVRSTFRSCRVGEERDRYHGKGRGRKTASAIVIASFPNPPITSAKRWGEGGSAEKKKGRNPHLIPTIFPLLIFNARRKGKEGSGGKKKEKRKEAAQNATCHTKLFFSTSLFFLLPSLSRRRMKKRFVRGKKKGGGGEERKEYPGSTFSLIPLLLSLLLSAPVLRREVRKEKKGSTPQRGLAL